jgi:hypothetical protein
VATGPIAAGAAFGIGGGRQLPPEMVRVPQFENDRVVAWKSVIPPGAQSTLHRHDRRRIVIGIVGGELKTVTPDGNATVTRYETGKAYWQEPMPAGETHRDVNDTARPIELVVVELKP